MDTIKTKTIGSGFAEAEESVLTETAKTAIVFQPQFHEGGVRGSIIRYKKDNHGQRLSPTSVDFRKLNPNEGVEIELNTEALTNLLQRIQQLQTVIASAGVQPGTHQYRITNANDVTMLCFKSGCLVEASISQGAPARPQHLRCLFLPLPHTGQSPCPNPVPHPGPVHIAGQVHIRRRRRLWRICFPTLRRMQTASPPARNPVPRPDPAHAFAKLGHGGVGFLAGLRHLIRKGRHIGHLQSQCRHAVGDHIGS